MATFLLILTDARIEKDVQSYPFLAENGAVKSSSTITLCIVPSSLWKWICWNEKVEEGKENEKYISKVEI